jgi:prepilin-type processing-associated H-X9-DG protein/prepilin-type N-terminal cleavage/methylation domain-containing protein
MSARIRKIKAFTLIELLVVIAIIASLISLLMPSIATMQQKADQERCVSNLRQIGVSGLLYANDHSERLPLIEPWPTKPLYPPSDNAQSLLPTLEPYGLTAAGLKCPSDLKGPNYYAREGSSYEWSIMANGQNTQAVKFPFFMGGQTAAIPMSKVILSFDYSGVHNGGSNVLFGDGHVAISTPPTGNSTPGN